MKNFAWLGLALLAGCPGGSSDADTGRGRDAPVVDVPAVDAPVAVADGGSEDVGSDDAPTADAGSDAGGDLDADLDAGEPVVCGGRAGATCNAQSFCDFAGLGCDFADGMGLCAPRPVACPEIFMPVCGCDHVTYDNGCLANAAGTDTAMPGPCP